MAQNAYGNGIDGCMEHATAVHEVIQHAKLNKKHCMAHGSIFEMHLEACHMNSYHMS